MYVKKAAQDWIENILSGLLKDYELKDKFNYDETGIFFECFASKFLFILFF
jgi:hypothetical protein